MIDNTELKIIQIFSNAFSKVRAIVLNDIKKEYFNVRKLFSSGNWLIRAYVIIKVLIFLNWLFAFLLRIIPISIQDHIVLSFQELLKIDHRSISNDSYLTEYPPMTGIALWDYNFIYDYNKWETISLDIDFNAFYKPFNDSIDWRWEEKIKRFLSFLSKELDENIYRISDVRFWWYTSNILTILNKEERSFLCGVYCLWPELYNWYKWEGVLKFKVWDRWSYSEFNLISDLYIGCYANYKICDLMDFSWKKYDNNISFAKVKYLLCEKTCRILENGEEVCEIKNKQTKDLSCI